MTKKTNLLLEIFKKSWSSFKQKHPGYATKYYDSIIKKVLACGDPGFGYVEFQCLDCGIGRHVVGFSCKTKFCLRCGRVFAEGFVSEVMEKLHEGVVYRHLILTIPEQLRSFFYENRHEAKLMNEFFRCGWSCLQEVINLGTKKDIKCGCLMVIHTVGRKGDYKPHLHILVMDGGIDKEKGSFIDLGFFPYKILHKKWQYHLLKMVKGFSGSVKIKKVVNDLWKQYPNGFVAQILKGTVPQNAKQLAKYLSKYLFRPSISLKRIKSFNEVSGEVVYEYLSHKTKKMEVEKTDVLTFIGRMVQQILPKGFQRIRYYGLQATSSYRKSKEMIESAMKWMLKTIVESNVVVGKAKLKYEDLTKVWRNNILKCKYCGTQMSLVKVWVRGKGTVFDYFSSFLGKSKLHPRVFLAEV